MYTERRPEANNITDRLRAIFENRHGGAMCSDGQSSAAEMFRKLLSGTPGTRRMPDAGPYASYYRTVLSDCSRNHRMNGLKRECVQRLIQCKSGSEQLEHALAEDQFKFDFSSAPMLTHSLQHVPTTFEQKIAYYRSRMHEVIRHVSSAYCGYEYRCNVTETEPDYAFVQYVLHLHRSELSRAQDRGVHTDEHVMGMCRSELSDYERAAIDSARADCAELLRRAHMESVRHLLHIMHQQAVAHMQPKTPQEDAHIRNKERAALENAAAKFYSEHGHSSEEIHVNDIVGTGEEGVVEPFLTMARDAFVGIRRLMCTQDIDAAELRCTRMHETLTKEYSDMCAIEDEPNVHAWRKHRQYTLAAMGLESHKSIMLQHQRGYVDDTSRQLRIEEWDDLFIEDMYNWMYSHHLVDWMDASIGGPGYDSEEDASSDDERFPVHTAEDAIADDAHARARQYEYTKAYKARRPKMVKSLDREQQQARQDKKTHGSRPEKTQTHRWAVRDARSFEIARV